MAMMRRPNQLLRVNQADYIATCGIPVAEIPGNEIMPAQVFDYGVSAVYLFSYVLQHFIQ
jgi:hypothetical protein